MTDTTDNVLAKIVAVADRWQSRYRSNGYADERLLTNGRTLIEMHAEILACKTLDEVDDVMGSRKWTHNSCDVCGGYSRSKVATFSVDGLKYEYSICAACLRAALDELNADSQ